MTEMQQNIILVDKPSGITSFDVIRRLRKEIGVWKMGHAGTLDPLASGLMIIGVGEGTKTLTELVKLPKVYVAEILLGVRTNSGDTQGEVLERVAVAMPAREQIEKVLGEIVGEGTLHLAVPIFSAIKRNGKKLYELAREGKTAEDIQPPVKEMKVTSTAFVSLAADRPAFTVELAVSSGTYVRSLAEEIGRRLGMPATMSALRRTKVGDFRVEDARKV